MKTTTEKKFDAVKYMRKVKFLIMIRVSSDEIKLKEYFQWFR